jgi:hypothetical protein
MLHQIFRVSLTAVIIALLGTANAAESSVESRLKHDVTFLASDECEGRGVGTQGINKAADFIAQEFAKAGLKPVGVDGSWFQPFTMTGTATRSGPSRLVLRGPLGQVIELTVDHDFRPVGLSAGGQATNVPVVFAGHAATAKDIKFDDFQGLDVAGKVLIVVRKTPRPDDKVTPFDGNKAGHHAALATKLVNADQHKAAAVLFVNDRATAQAADPLMDFAYTASASSPAAVPALHVLRAVVDQLLQSVRGVRLSDIENDVDRDLQPRNGPLTGWTATVQVGIQRPTIAVKNIVGVLDGSGPLANENVVIGAHYDHLGLGGSASLAPGVKAIHHGADDNGSGTTMLIELARRFGAINNRVGRRLVFIAFSGEESGLLGSQHYCKNPLFPLGNTVAMINMDMVGRLRPAKPQPPAKPGQRDLAWVMPWLPASWLPGVWLPSVPAAAATATADTKPKPKESASASTSPPRDNLIVYGTGTAKTFDSLLESLNKDYNFQLKKVAGGTGPSDHQSFYEKKIPVFFFFTGEHADYHKPSDTADKINISGMAKITNLVTDVIRQVSTVADRPTYVAVQESTPARGPEGSMPRIGIRPDYGDGQDGVLLGGVNANGPAAKGGLKEGDRIVSVGGKTVKNLEAYMVLMMEQKKGQPIELGIIRGGKPLSVKVLPE